MSSGSITNPSMLGARGKPDRGEQFLSYDFVWHLLPDTMITSEWGTPEMVESGVVPELLLGRKYGHQLHVWDVDSRKLKQTARSR